MSKRVLLVGPINAQGLGGRYEEMKVWATLLEECQFDVTVFSMFNSRFSMGSAQMYESAALIWPFFWKAFAPFRKFSVRFWGSRWFKTRRDTFFDTWEWAEFASGFDHIVLFITHQSRELRIFESDLTVPISVRFTGTIHDFSALQRHASLPDSLPRNYIFHSTFLAKGLNTTIRKVFIDQTTLAEQALLNNEITGQLKVFGMIGLFMEVKQMDQVIELFEEFPEFRLKIFGIGELQSQFERLIQESNLKNVELGGFVPPSRIDGLYADIDCLIINSKEETGPMTGIEAMAAGKLILSKPVGAMADRLPDNGSIFVSIDDLKRKILQLSGLPADEILQAKTVLRERYRKNYSISVLKSAIEDLVA